MPILEQSCHRLESKVSRSCALEDSLWAGQEADLWCCRSSDRRATGEPTQDLACSSVKTFIKGPTTLLPSISRYSAPAESNCEQHNA